MQMISLGQLAGRRYVSLIVASQESPLAEYSPLALRRLFHQLVQLVHPFL